MMSDHHCQAEATARRTPNSPMPVSKVWLAISAARCVMVPLAS